MLSCFCLNSAVCRFVVCPSVPQKGHFSTLPVPLSCSGKKMNGSLDNPDQPDMDAIKMFVGQIPRSWSEDQLRELFESYGAVYEINVLRDRSQNPPQSKGECLLATRLQASHSGEEINYQIGGF